MRNQGTSDSSGGFEHVAVLLGRLKLAWMLRHFPPQLVWSLYVFVNGFLTRRCWRVLTRSPVRISIPWPDSLPSLSRRWQRSSPRNTILGHAHWSDLRLHRILPHRRGTLPFGIHTGLMTSSFVYWPRILAADTIAVGYGRVHGPIARQSSTCGCDHTHRFAGIISKPKELVIIEVAVFLLVAQALVHQPTGWAGLSLLEILRGFPRRELSIAAMLKVGLH